MKRFLLVLTCLLPAALGLASVGVVMIGGTLIHLGIGLALHVAAAFTVLPAARRRRGGPLASAERDTVFLTSLLLPVLGPAFGFWLPRSSVEENVENAHEVVERYMAHVKPHVPVWERSLYTGNFDRDLARKLDIESYREVLRHGETDQKRNALFRLAELGEPHHLALIRGCLEDEDQEVRLYAYGELDRLMRGFEEAVRSGREGVKESESDPEAQLALGNAHYDLATSGILDPRTSAFHLRVATDCAGRAKELASDDPRSAILLARVHAHLGDLEQADECLDELPPHQQEDLAVCRVRAEVAFLARDFNRAREQAGRLLMAEEDVPGWLAALCVAEEPSEEASR